MDFTYFGNHKKTLEISLIDKEELIISDKSSLNYAIVSCETNIAHCRQDGVPPKYRMAALKRDFCTFLGPVKIGLSIKPEANIHIKKIETGKIFYARTYPVFFEETINVEILILGGKKKVLEQSLAIGFIPFMFKISGKGIFAFSTFGGSHNVCLESNEIAFVQRQSLIAFDENTYKNMELGTYGGVETRKYMEITFRIEGPADFYLQTSNISQVLVNQEKENGFVKWIKDNMLAKLFPF